MHGDLKTAMGEVGLDTSEGKARSHVDNFSKEENVTLIIKRNDRTTKA